MLPGVSINLANGALGGTPIPADGVRGLVVSAVAAPSGLAYGATTVIFSLADAIALGITQTATPFAYRQVKEFYDEAGPSAELWLMVVPETSTLTTLGDVTNTTAGAYKLIEAARGRIRLLGMAVKPNGSYSPTLTGGIDKDSLDAITPANAMAAAFATRQMPLRILVEGRFFAAANAASLEDLRTRTSPRVGVVTFSTTNDGSASVGMVLGRSAAGGPSRNIGRVRSGAMNTNTGYNGSAPAGPDGVTQALHDKGYICARTLVGRTGIFISDDPTCAPASDDYCQITRGLVIDKAQRIAYDVYLNEVNEQTEIVGGKIHPAVVATLQANIIQAIRLQMQGQISDVACYIDPEQDVIATNELKVVLRIVPVGYFKYIQVSLGFAKAV